MSEVKLYKGKLKLVEKYPLEDLEELCERVAGTHGYMDLTGHCEWSELIYDEFQFEYVVIGNDLYKIIENEELDEDVFATTVNVDGTISYIVQYYNGGCGFEEALQEAISNIKERN